MSTFILFLLSYSLLPNMAFSQAPTPCRNPLEGTPPACSFIESKHRCDVGAGLVPVSAVFPTASPNDAARFNDIANKKLACCMNEFNPAIPDDTAKFDCVENAKVRYIDFNDLWSSVVDEDPDMMNAVYLTNAAGKPISGFYTLSGARCDDLSEFAAPLSGIQPYVIDPTMMSGQQMKVGGVRPVTGVLYLVPNVRSFTDLQSKLNKKFPDPTNPTGLAQALHCPILVRAAMVAACPSNPMLPVAQESYTFPNGAGTKTRCAAASSIQMHVRIEQLYEITGTPKMQTIDTVLTPAMANSVSMERILARKNGTVCGSGTIPWRNVCAWPTPVGP
jgi:hypothetical protein